MFQFHSTHKTLHNFRLNSSFFLLLPLLINNLVKAHIFINAGCSQEKYAPNSPFEPNLNSILSSLVSSSSQSSYNSFAAGNDTSTPEAAAFGLYQCRGDFRIPDCATCIQSAVNQIGLVCPCSYGASLQLEGCFLRYEHVDFLGKLDTGLRFKKCSRNSVKNDVEFFKRRDDVLADLETGVGFKVSSSGLVEGYVQCLGDLSSADCSSCIAAAVGELKNLCGSAAAADVYLGQCFARYWSSGYYDSSDSSDEDQVGKTVAIIVGIIAAVAILIVLLSVCRRSMSSLAIRYHHLRTTPICHTRHIIRAFRDDMGVLAAIAKRLDTLVGPGIMLLFPLYASLRAIESPSTLDDQQWLTYWIIYSFTTLFELTCWKILVWLPFWPYVKLLFCVWLVLPVFNGASCIYENFVRKYVKFGSTVIGNFSEEQRKVLQMMSLDARKSVVQYVEKNGWAALERAIKAAEKEVKRT